MRRGGGSQRRQPRGKACSEANCFWQHPIRRRRSARQAAQKGVWREGGEERGEEVGREVRQVCLSECLLLRIFNLMGVSELWYSIE